MEREELQAHEDEVYALKQKTEMQTVRPSRSVYYRARQSPQSQLHGQNPGFRALLRLDAKEFSRGEK